MKRWWWGLPNDVAIAVRYEPVVDWVMGARNCLPLETLAPDLTHSGRL
ncbi:hypothetical protein J0895_09925 [Phormidium pseudopriestleyi FRX01]|uniref:Uncharacterized protein n=1 Tax=Phormidium pseudopriestleyi FRX01 TaxID=1759528 RepID=A0ABS3FRH0_9CYAN|nr:hypothetical protein [Phormidium pseudopriestleyi]MBO0349418.1 hypothetical protein [Phormidium pseudopriestleyi FRX01]